MGNSCTSHRGGNTKVSRASSEASYTQHIRFEVPPRAPRNSDVAESVTVSPATAVHPAFLIPINHVLDVDEGGSPAVDVTKSLESIHAWFQDLSESDADERDAVDLSPDADFSHRVDEATISLPAVYDADEEPRGVRIVRALALQTPKITTRTVASFF